MHYSTNIVIKSRPAAPVEVTAAKVPVPDFLKKGAGNNSAGRSAPQTPVAQKPTTKPPTVPVQRANPPAAPARPAPKITISVYETDAPGGRFIALHPDTGIWAQDDDRVKATKKLAVEIAKERGEKPGPIFNSFEISEDAGPQGPAAELEGDDVVDDDENDFGPTPSDDGFEPMGDEPPELEDDGEDDFQPQPVAPAKPVRGPRAQAPVENSEWDTRPSDVLSFLKAMSLVALRVRNVQTKGFAEQIVRANFQAAMQMVQDAGGDAAAFKQIFVHYGKPDVATFGAAFSKSFRKAMKSARMFSDIRTVPPKYKDLLDPILSAISNPQSENQMGLIGKRISTVQDKNIEKEFAKFVLDTVGDHGDLSSNIDDIVQNQGGSDTGRLSADQIAQMKETDPEGLKQYRKLRADLAKRLKAEYKNIILNTGRPFIPMNLFIRKCEQAGLPTDLFHPDLHDTALIGMNDNANYTDKFGNEIISQSTGKPAGINPDFGLTINENYEPGGGRGRNWVLYSTSPLGTKNYLFGKSYVADSVANKFSKVADATSKLEAAKKRWRQDVLAQSDDDHPAKVYAMILEFMYITTCRPGTKEGMTAGSRTFGAMNFPSSAVKPVGQGLGVTIPIKSGKIEKYLLDPSKVGNSDKKAMQALVQFLKAKVAGKQPDQIAFSISGKRPDPNKLNAYMKAIGLPITAHKIRTLRGTLLAKQILEPLAEKIRAEEKAKGRLPDVEVQNRFKAAMTEVGKLLAHVRRTKDGEEQNTWITAAKAYVDAAYTMEWFANLKYRPPKELSDAASILDRDGDGIPD